MNQYALLLPTFIFEPEKSFGVKLEKKKNIFFCWEKAVFFFF